MTARFQRTENVLLGAAANVAASTTAGVVSKVFPIPIYARNYFKAACNVTSVTGGTNDLIFQTSYDNGTTWINVETVSLTVTVSAAQFRFELLADVVADQSYLPLGSLGRFVITTIAGETSVLAGIYVPA